MASLLALFSATPMCARARLRPSAHYPTDAREGSVAQYMAPGTIQWKCATDDRQQLKRASKKRTTPPCRGQNLTTFSTCQLSVMMAVLALFNYPILAAFVLTAHPDSTHGFRCLTDLQIFDALSLCMTHAGPCFLHRSQTPYYIC
jgi:hypothetical protein